MSQTCEWSGCDQAATYKAEFTNPYEEVLYCDEHKTEVRRTRSPWRIDRL